MMMTVWCISISSQVGRGVRACILASRILLHKCTQAADTPDSRSSLVTRQHSSLQFHYASSIWFVYLFIYLDGCGSLGWA
jgi:hypothetical protein